jgi:hypothetical protein
VLITADSLTDPRAVAALQNAAALQKAKTVVLTIPQLPFQGALADPYIPEPVAAAVMSCDVWFDMTFPYIAGSQVHDKAMKTNRVRTLLFHDLDNGGLARLFGGVDFDRLFALQNTFDAAIGGAVGKQARVTTAKGTDVTFTIAKPATKKIRHINQPGTFTPPGSAVIYPEPASVKGKLVVEAVFHEYYTLLKLPITMTVDGKIREISGGGSDLKVTDRALRRAGGGNYGSIIHFSHGFHPAARFNGQSFMEDVRVAGNDAVGLGTPWWEPGGGENHPDAVLTMQTLWIDGQQMVRDGVICGSPELIQLEAELNSNLR